MQTRAAVLWGIGQEWRVENIELHPPKAGEVLVKMAAAGLCHSDEHLVTGDMVISGPTRAVLGLDDPFPMIGGHEGAGVVIEVGPGVTSLRPGDHVAGSFVPSCGRCRWCVTGRSPLCDLGAQVMALGQITDGTSRHFCRGQALNTMAKLGTFSEHTVVAEQSLVKVDPDFPLPAVALVSCGVTTGWGSAVYRAGTSPGDTVVVVGIGGVGANALQGARLAGARHIVAVDPVEFKRTAAFEFGATHTAESMDEATTIVREITRGEMAERVIMTPGVMHGELLAGAISLTAKAGTCVITAAAPIEQMTAQVNLFELVMYNKEIKGVLFGSGNPRVDIPKLLELYRAGLLKLDELITRTYPLDKINDGYADMRAGRNIRGVLVFD